MGLLCFCHREHEEHDVLGISDALKVEFTFFEAIFICTRDYHKKNSTDNTHCVPVTLSP